MGKFKIEADWIIFFNFFIFVLKNTYIVMNHVVESSDKISIYIPVIDTAVFSGRISVCMF